jgi:hypothetical protein
MSYPRLVAETDPLAPPKRAFFDNRAVPYQNLAEIRAAMVEDDMRLIGLIGSRMMQDFEVDPVNDPTQSARNRVGQLAMQARPRHQGFPEMMTAVYDVLASETSPLIDVIDPAIVGTIAARTHKAMLATVFKLDRANGPDPVQQ